jgi:hypothetical protein
MNDLPPIIFDAILSGLSRQYPEALPVNPDHLKLHESRMQSLPQEIAVALNLLSPLFAKDYARKRVLAVPKAELQGYLDTACLFITAWVSLATSDDEDDVMIELEQIADFKLFPADMRSAAQSIVQDNLDWAKAMVATEDEITGEAFIRRLAARRLSQPASREYHTGIATARDTWLAHNQAAASFITALPGAASNEA